MFECHQLIEDTPQSPDVTTGRWRHVFKDVERGGWRERERERDCAPLVVVRFVLAYLRREVVWGANTCAGQLHSTAVHHHRMM